jgi:formylglycine-generating enzyme required for sulfatase activity/tRNA A-37 threonylcarbamoyl transferase component Bud32
MSLIPGEIINKRYRIVTLLRCGPYGGVYRAWDRRDACDVALKEYLNPSPEITRLFRAEARRLSSLRHAQLPAVRDHFTIEAVGQYLISDYVDGVDLQTLIDTYGLLPSDLIVGWLQAACVPLTYLHQQKQLHLNLKPANIRLTAQGDVFLVDTGLPGLGISVAGPGYGPPEQQTQTAVSVASDIYGLGATLYTLLTAQAPPDALRRESGLMELVPAREINADVEPYLSVVAGRAMDLRPEVRYATAAEFAHALDRPIGRPVTPGHQLRRAQPGGDVYPPPAATAYAAPYRPRRTRRQIEQRTIWGLLGLLLLIILLGAGATFFGPGVVPGGHGQAATATVQSQIIAALTAITTVTPTAAPTETVAPTPAPFVDSQTGARMLLVPGGIFRMGFDESERDERPSRVIRLDPYFLDETEVTNGQYAVCVEAGACRAPTIANPTYHPAYYGSPAYENYPVVYVTWGQTNTFCQWRGARLPSEAEWERAAAFDPVALKKLRYPWGDEFDGSLANFCDRNCPRNNRDTTFNDGHRDTAPVASFPDGRSPLGFYDMAGNVMEWVADWYDHRYYETGTATNPMGPVDGEVKVVRGGSYLSGANDLTTTRRLRYHPDGALGTLGFRCAMDVP